MLLAALALIAAGCGAEAEPAPAPAPPRSLGVTTATPSTERTATPMRTPVPVDPRLASWAEAL
jgi:hypothetical protein